MDIELTNPDTTNAPPPKHDLLSTLLVEHILMVTRHLKPSRKPKILFEWVWERKSPRHRNYQTRNMTYTTPFHGHADLLALSRT